MRLWHIDLVSVLPRMQLLAQWRELNSIFKKQDNHILINYIYNYDKKYLYNYSMAVITEMRNRNYKIKNWLNFNTYFQMIDNDCIECDLRFKEHDREYLSICYYNLKEKYLRSGITEYEWKKVEEKYKKLIKESNL